MFPYYIVRFKHLGWVQTSIIPTMFPYYIVRFKLCSDFICVHCQSSFPYYIVRFKHIISAKFPSQSMSFHTTQYDLNLFFCGLLQAGLGQFPYYIVRFKLAKIGIILPRFASFHTTQYDLNCDELLAASYPYQVSILHSTI